MLYHTAQDIPVRFPQFSCFPLEGDEKILITQTASEKLAIMGDNRIDDISHVYVDRQSADTVRLNIYRIGGAFPGKQLLGIFKFSDRNLGPLSLNQVWPHPTPTQSLLCFFIQTLTSKISTKIWLITESLLSYSPLSSPWASFIFY